MTGTNSTATGEPRLLWPIDAPSLMASSPHPISFDAFACRFGGSPRRRTLIEALREMLCHLDAGGITPLCLLAGGGFTRDGDAPNDIDALVVYAIKSGAPEDVMTLLHRQDGDLDLRFVPGDAHPALLIRMSCFFHTLYQSRDRSDDQPSFLVSWGDN